MSESCDNAIRDGDETDVDCGGTCTPCANGKACSSHEDCSSAICIEALECAACMEGSCGEEAYCDFGDGECRPRKPLGFECEQHFECLEGLIARPALPGSHQL